MGGVVISGFGSLQETTFFCHRRFGEDGGGGEEKEVFSIKRESQKLSPYVFFVQYTKEGYEEKGGNETNICTIF